MLMFKLRKKIKTYNMSRLCRIGVCPHNGERYCCQCQCSPSDPSISPAFIGYSLHWCFIRNLVSSCLPKNERVCQAHRRQSIPISKFVTGLSPKSSLVFWTSSDRSLYGSDRSDDRTEGMACSLRISEDSAFASSRSKMTRKSSSNSNVKNLSSQANI
jgi:hypothetical protein